MPARGKLTEKQRRFAEHYATNGNMTAAARAAGYKGNDKTLGQVGHENLKKPEIASRVAELRPKTPTIADREERQAFLTAVVRGELRDICPDPMGARIKALDLLNKMGGEYIQRIEHSGPGGNPIEIAAGEADSIRSILEDESARDRLIEAFGVLGAASAQVEPGNA